MNLYYFCKYIYHMYHTHKKYIGYGLIALLYWYVIWSYACVCIKLYLTEALLYGIKWVSMIRGGGASWINSSALNICIIISFNKICLDCQKHWSQDNLHLWKLSSGISLKLILSSRYRNCHRSYPSLIALIAFSSWSCDIVNAALYAIYSSLS